MMPAAVFLIALTSRASQQITSLTKMMPTGSCEALVTASARMRWLARALITDVRSTPTQIKITNPSIICIISVTLMRIPPRKMGNVRPTAISR